MLYKIDNSVYSYLLNLINSEGLSLRCNLFLKFNMASNGKIYYPETHPINETIYNKIATPISKGMGNTTVLLNEIYNTDELNKLILNEAQLKHEFPNDSMWMDISLNKYFNEIVAWINNLSLCPLLNYDIAMLFDWDYLYEMNTHGEFIKYYEENKDSIPWNIYNLNNIDLTEHFKILQYLTKCEADDEE